MEARIFRVAILAACLGSLGASYRTTNFIVNAGSDQFAKQVGQTAEKMRRDLAIEWLGRELPRWQSPCPITVKDGPHLGAGGATSFPVPYNSGPVFCMMSIQGSKERILDSVSHRTTIGRPRDLQAARPPQIPTPRGGNGDYSFSHSKGKKQRSD